MNRSNRSFRRGLAAALSILMPLLVLSACGPALIGAGIAEAIDSKKPSPPPPLPEVMIPANTLQPECDATMVAFAIEQEQGLTARVRLEYDVGQGRQRVPAANLTRYQANGTPAAIQPVVDAAGNFELPTAAAGGVTYLFLWRHLTDLGVVERRGVSLYLVIGLAQRLQPSFSADEPGVTTSQLFANRTIGREISELSGLVLSRENPANPESEFVVQAVLRDRGADRERTSFAFRFAVSDPPTAQDFVPLPPLEPTAITESEELDGRRRSDLTFKFSPLLQDVNIPFGTFKLTLEVQHRESYGFDPFRNGVPPIDKVGVPQTVELANTQVGAQPVIESFSVLDPAPSSATGGDPGKAWLRLPLLLKVRNPSSRAVTLRVTGTYEITEGVRPITPYVTGSPFSDPEFVLQPGQVRRHYLVWNVAKDEGLGNLVAGNDPVNSPLRTAQLFVRAEVVAAAGTSLAGVPLAQTVGPRSTKLSTSPFVNFRTNLQPEARRIWSSGEQITQRTRDLFFSRVGTTSVQDTILGLDQQFEPTQIIPPPPLFQFPTVNGVYDIAATDFDTGQPDCLVWLNSQFYYVRWTGSVVPVPEPIQTSAQTLYNRAADAVSFGLANGTWDVAVFYSWEYVASGSTSSLRVRLAPVVRNPGGVFTALTRPEEVFPLSLPVPLPGNISLDPSLVAGEFDGNPDTREIVIGSFGREYGGGPVPGLLHMWTFGLDANGVTVSSPVPMTAPPALSGDPQRDCSKWLLARWLDGAEPPGEGVVLVRQLDGTNPSPPNPGLNRGYDVWTLQRGATSGTIVGESWALLTGALTGAASAFPDVGQVQLRRIFAEDLDGPTGVRGSDLLLVGEQQSGTDTFVDMWLYAQRGALPAKWRRIANDLRVRDPVTLAEVPGRMQASLFELVDVNGDRLLDLATWERVDPASTEPHYNYLASALSGVAGSLTAVGDTAGSTNAVLPGLIDANEDGLDDVISGTVLHIAQLDGTYFDSGLGNFAGSAQSRHHVERMWLDGPPNSIEILVSDATTPSQNLIDRLGGLGGDVNFTRQPLMAYSLGGLGQLREARPLMAASSALRRAKDIVGLDGAGPFGTVRRAQIDPQALTSAPSALWTGGSAVVSAGIALVRRGSLGAEGPAFNLSVQDVVVASSAGPGQIVVLSSDPAIPPFLVQLPPGQDVVRVAEASLSGDTREDVCVLTEDAISYRLYCLEQHPTTALAPPAAVRELARFAKPFGGACAVRSFRFDRGARSLANGLLLLDATATGSTRSEARLIRPIVDNGALALRMVRSPLNQPIDVPLEVVVTDSDQDGLIEVIGGEVPSTSGLKRLRTNVAPPGN